MQIAGDMIDKVDQQYRFRGWMIQVPFWILSLFLFLRLAYQVWVNDQWDFLLLILFVSSVLVGLVYRAWLKRSYKCPECGELLGKPSMSAENREYNYECKSCGIQVLIKEATPHKDCDERLIESVINEPTQF